MGRACHHPMRRKDIMPTPSQPTKSWIMLLAVVKVIIAIKNSKRYFAKVSCWGSVAMYHLVNSKIDPVISRAIGRNIVAYWSNMKLICKLFRLFHVRWVVTASRPAFVKISRGARLVTVESFTAVVMWERVLWGGKRRGLSRIMAVTISVV